MTEAAGSPGVGGGGDDAVAADHGASLYSRTQRVHAAGKASFLWMVTGVFAAILIGVALLGAFLLR